jgi:hypothetical protein
LGVFDKVERKLEGAVNGAFARAFKGDVQPIEIATALQREIDTEAKALGKDRRLVPNAFQVGLAQHDYDRLAPYSRTLNNEIIPTLRDHAGERGYVFNGPITIDYILDPSLPTGRMSVASAVVANVSDRQPGAAAAPRSNLVLEVNGVRHPLVPPGFVIGRGSESDLRINDPGVSRRHARVTVAEAPGGALEITIEDLGSTNGVIVNGTKVAQTALGDGSRIEMGTTRMLVHSPVGE